MPTLLSFRLAVKALGKSLGVCAAVFLPVSFVNCASRGAEHPAPGPATGLVREAPTSALNDAGAVATLDARDAAIVAAPVAVASAPVVSTSLDLSFEQPYPSDARPRAENPLKAAADDEELARWNIGGTSDPNYVSSQASFHPGTRVVVDADFPGPHRKPRRNARGLTAERIQAQTRAKGYWPFRLCFEAGQRERKDAGGETKVRFSIGVRGTVLSAHLISTELRNRRTTDCLLTELRKLRFAPVPARRTDVITSIRIWPGDVDLPETTPAPAAAIETGNGFDPAAIGARVLAKRAELNACFDEPRRTDPTLWGRLALTVILEVDGTVHRVNEIESHFPNAAAARCVAATVSGMVFPSVNGKPFTFVLAFRLAPSKTPSPEPASPSDLDAGSD